MGFPSVVNNAFSGLGFSAEAALYAFPQEMFLQGSDLTPIQQNLDKVIDGLTRWKPTKETKDASTPHKITIEGNDYREAFTNMNHFFLRKLWSDGLPVQPPTKEYVYWILTGTDLPSDTLVGGGRILPRGGIATIEMLAVSLAMAGGRPEYMPVLIAAIEGITNPVMTHQMWNATTGYTTPMVLVNGPITKQIRLNSGYGCLGPSSEYPAGASIGRAIRFILMNLGGAIPGKGTMSLYAGPGRYTSLVFGEDEDGLPGDWVPLNVEQGFTRGSNTLTTDVIGLYTEVMEGVVETEEDTVDNLKSIARFLGYSFNVPPSGIPGYLLIGRSTAKQFSKLGWSKAKIQSFLWEHAEVLEPLTAQIKLWVKDPTRFNKVINWPTRMAKNPEDIKIVVCGGAQSGHSFWLQGSERLPQTTGKS